MNGLGPLVLLAVLGMLLAGCSGFGGDAQDADPTTPAASPDEPKGTDDRFVQSLDSLV